MDRRSTDYIVVHCSATRPDMDIGAPEIDSWHRARGFNMIGYHLVIRRNGAIEAGRRLNARGAHVRGYNDRSIGVCVVGGLAQNSEPAATFTEAQGKALMLVIAMLKCIWPGATVVGHRDLSPDLDGDGVVEQHEWLKACPSFDAALFVETGQFIFWAGGVEPSPSGGG